MSKAREHLESAERWLDKAEREMEGELYTTALARAYTAIAQTHAQLAGLAEALEESEWAPFPLPQDAEAHAAVDDAIAKGEPPF